VVYAWAKKEFRNLKICKQARVPVPTPFAFDKNVLLMEFLGEKGMPDSTLKQLGSDNPERDCKILLNYIRRLYKHGFVHSDASEFNVMTHGYPKYKFYFIDLGQGVLIGHPKAKEFLKRDVRNILRYFKGYGVKRDLNETLKWILSVKPSSKKG
jgi:RIO kinase 1